MNLSTNLIRLSLFVSFLVSACGPSLGTLQARALHGDVQADAPLHARQSITIAAPRERVYEKLVDFAQWPLWQPNITRVVPPAAVAPGAHFTWVNGGAQISSQLAAVIPNELVAWTGSVSTAKAVHVWRFSSPSPGTTRVDVAETMDGFLLTWFYGQSDLEAEMARSLTALQNACEGR